MLRRFLLLAFAATALPAAVNAQAFNVSARAGTLGLGGEVGVTVLSNLGVRGGVGVIPIDYEGTYSELDYSVTPTSPLMNLGVDFYTGFGTLRVGGGVLVLSNPTEMSGEYVGTFEVGDETFVGDARIDGELDHGSAAPYVIFGTGRATGSGMGIFLDIGAAFLSEPELTLTASGTATQDPRFQEALEEERQAAEQDANDFLRILPIFSFGFRFGF